MNNMRIAAPITLTLLLAACSGNMGSGATPPVNTGMSMGGGPINTQSNTSGSGSSTSGSSATPSPLSAQGNIEVAAASVVDLPQAGGFRGKVCIAPEGDVAGGCAASAAASAAPTATASATPAPSASAKAPSVLITPPSKKWQTSGMHVVLGAYPTSAIVRDDAAEDGATNPLAMYEITPTANLVVDGLSAFTLNIPKDQASPEHHYAFVLYDRDLKGAKTGSVFAHKKSSPHVVALASSAQLAETSLNFVDHTTKIVLTAKHRYVAVLYSDTVTPTPGPSGSATSAASPFASASPSASASAFPTPVVSYPTASAAPATASPATR